MANINTDTSTIYITTQLIAVITKNKSVPDKNELTELEEIAAYIKTYCDYAHKKCDN